MGNIKFKIPDSNFILGSCQDLDAYPKNGTDHPNTHNNSRKLSVLIKFYDKLDNL
jgi:hypothetical protein